MALGYEFAPVDVRIMTHPRAIRAGIEAMGLWLFGMAYAKQQGTGGIVHREAALSAWGGRRNGDLTKRLIASGLWSTNEDGDFVIHNYEAKAGRKSPSAERMARFREKKRVSSVTCDVTGDTDRVTSDASPVTRSSISVSVSNSLSDPEGVQGEAQTENHRVVYVDTGRRSDPRTDEVWAHYVATMARYGRKVRKVAPNDDDRKNIRNALRSLDVEACKLAVEGLFLSAFHLGQNDRGKEYLAIFHALKPNNVDGFILAAERERALKAPTAPEPAEEEDIVTDPAEYARIMAIAMSGQKGAA